MFTGDSVTVNSFITLLMNCITTGGYIFNLCLSTRGVQLLTGPWSLVVRGPFPREGRLYPLVSGLRFSLGERAPQLGLSPSQDQDRGTPIHSHSPHLPYPLSLPSPRQDTPHTGYSAASTPFAFSHRRTSFF